MTDELHAIIVDHRGRKVLLYLEPSGDEAILHGICVVKGFGQADLKKTFRLREDQPLDEVWAFFGKDGFAAAAEDVVSEVEKIEALADE